MRDASPWRIPPDALDWECGWEGDEVFPLRYFRALPLSEKIRAVEEMTEVAALFAKKQPREERDPGTGA